MVILYNKLNHLKTTKWIAFFFLASKLIKYLYHIIVVLFKTENGEVAFINFFKNSIGFLFYNLMLFLFETVTYHR